MGIRYIAGCNLIRVSGNHFKDFQNLFSTKRLKPWQWHDTIEEFISEKVFSERSYYFRVSIDYKHLIEEHFAWTECGLGETYFKWVVDILDSQKDQFSTYTVKEIPDYQLALFPPFRIAPIITSDVTRPSIAICGEGNEWFHQRHFNFVQFPNVVRIANYLEKSEVCNKHYIIDWLMNHSDHPESKFSRFLKHQLEIDKKLAYGESVDDLIWSLDDYDWEYFNSISKIHEYVEIYYHALNNLKSFFKKCASQEGCWVLIQHYTE